MGLVADDRIVLVLPLHHVHGIVNVTLTPARRRRLLRGARRLRRRRRVGAPGVRRDHRVHGRADDLRPARRGVGGRRRRDPPALVGRRRRAAADGVGLGGAAGVDARALARAHRPHAARALRHDRARHGAVEHARATGARPRRRAVPRRRGAPRRRHRRRRPRRRARRAAGARPAGVRRVLAAARGHGGGVRRRLVPHRRRRRARARAATGCSGRSSVDIIKTGGEKVSALEIEEVLPHPSRQSPTAPSSASTTTSGASGSPLPSCRRRRRRSTPTPCGRGASSSWPRRRSRRASCSSTSCPATRSARSSRPEVAELF